MGSNRQLFHKVMVASLFCLSMHASKYCALKVLLSFGVVRGNECENIYLIFGYFDSIGALALEIAAVPRRRFRIE